MTPARSASRFIAPVLAALAAQAAVLATVAAACCTAHDPSGGFERSHFSTIQAASRFGFLLGNLVLHYRMGDAWDTMIFER